MGRKTASPLNPCAVGTQYWKIKHSVPDGTLYRIVIFDLPIL